MVLINKLTYFDIISLGHKEIREIQTIYILLQGEKYFIRAFCTPFNDLSSDPVSRASHAWLIKRASFLEMLRDNVDPSFIERLFPQNTLTQESLTLEDAEKCVGKDLLPADLIPFECQDCDPNLLNAYIQAVAEGNSAQVESLAEQGVYLNHTVQNGATTAYIASSEGHFEVIETLYRLGADLNQAKQDGTAPACIASQRGHVAAIEFFHELRGTSMNFR